MKYISRTSAICLEQKTCCLPCFCSCSLYNIKTVRTQRYSSVTVFSLYMLIDLSICRYVYTGTHIYLYTCMQCSDVGEGWFFTTDTPETFWSSQRDASQFLYKEASSFQAEGRKKPETAGDIIFLHQSLIFFFSWYCKPCTRGWIPTTEACHCHVLSQVSEHCKPHPSSSNSLVSVHPLLSAQNNAHIWSSWYHLHFTFSNVTQNLK